MKGNICLSIGIFVCIHLSQMGLGGNQLLQLNWTFPKEQDEEKKEFRIMFYNVENLFDPFDDTLTNDDEFTPNGIRHWTYRKFIDKINKLYKVIISAGEWQPPDVVGLCEIENRWVLNRLVYDSPLAKFEYKIIHRDSPDPRGIDIAFLYLEDSFIPLKNDFIRVELYEDSSDQTREILHVEGIIHNRDTVHIFMNHWPSRWKGWQETKWKRETAASVLRMAIDTLLYTYPGAKIIIAGDFNAEPDDHCIREILLKEQEKSFPGINCLYNMSLCARTKYPGTLKYQGTWYLFDQFIVSDRMLRRSSECAMQVIDHNFLMEQDDTYLGEKPFRTFIGYRYHSGFSDHLPVILTIQLNPE